MFGLDEKIRNLENFKAISNYIPDDNSRFYDMEEFIQAFLARDISAAKVLDLGCGEGNSIEFFKSIDADVNWHGVDIHDSPEVRRRTREEAAILTFDGVNLPYPDSHFDLIYCNQVLEHVRYPDQLIAEALRVLRPGGLFVGAVSYLEPYHSYSIFNFTPYGVVSVFSDAGFKLEEIRPGVDASHLILRQLFNRSRPFRFLWGWNYLYFLCDLMGVLFRLGHRERNFLKIQFAGHLTFLARVPGNE